MRSAHVIPLLLVCACSRTDERREQPSAMAPQLSGTTRLHMRNCPSAVPSAKTIWAPTRDGVELIITSDNPDARRQIVALGQLHSALGEPLWAMPPHTGAHSGPGTIGHCPIIHAKTIVTSTPTPDGTRIHVRAREPAMARELQRITELRVKALEMTSS